LIYNNKNLTIEQVKERSRKYGFECVSSYYENNKTKVILICPNGHISNIRWINFNGKCKKCSYIKQRLTIEEVKNYALKEEYECISNNYINSHHKLRMKCSKGHNFDITQSDFKQGGRCPVCSRERVANYHRKNIEEVINFIEKENYKCLTKYYKNAHSKLKLVCPEGHEFISRWDGFGSGARCPICYRINNRGQNHPCWRGGSFEGYCEVWLDKEFKESIKQRDGHTCLNPCCMLKLRNNKNLVIHHINYNKKDCRPSNLILICRSCNAAANFNRNWYKSWYKAIIFRRYEYINA